MVSICTPTFNRRPFIPFMIQCFLLQTYPRHRMEWIIIDDGTDPVGDLIESFNIPQIRYIRLTEKVTLGKKRNMCNDAARGDILVYADDDDYYPPERVSHAVDMLMKHPEAQCAGSSVMFLYFNHIQKMYQFGPYGPNHSTAATFAFRRTLLETSRFDEFSSVAEEKHFLKNYTVPFVQLDPLKSILVFSHNHNSCDKRKLLVNISTGPNDTTPNRNPYVKESALTPANFIKHAGLLRFFTQEVDKLLDAYEPGELKHKPDVNKQIQEMETKRTMEQQLRQFSHENQSLKLENSKLKEEIGHLKASLTKIIQSKIEKKKELASESVISSESV